MLDAKDGLDPWREVRAHFDNAPYPEIPLEQTPKNESATLYIHNLTTALYARNKSIKGSEGKAILDAGCGSGYKSLILAEANPGARILGVDISDGSIGLARKRLAHHGFEDVDFRTLPIEEVPGLGRKFDYINCDETLYLLPDPLSGLRALREVLDDDGVLRVNFHSAVQRMPFFRAQAANRLVCGPGALDQEDEVDRARGLMHALMDQVHLKRKAWDHEGDDQWLLANHLLRGDKGLSIAEFLDLLRLAGLEFVRMLDWQTWDLMSLFKFEADLPRWLRTRLGDLSEIERLQLYELLEPKHRLLDLWCGHPRKDQEPGGSLRDFQQADWEASTLHLHPQLRNDSAKQMVQRCVLTLRPLRLQEWLALPGQQGAIESLLAATLLPLWREPQRFGALVEHWLRLRPVNPVSMAPSHPMEAHKVVQEMVVELEGRGLLLVESPGAREA